MQNNTMSTVKVSDKRLSGTMSLVLASALISSIPNNEVLNTEKFSLMDTQSLISTNDHSISNTPYINNAQGTSFKDSFYQSIVKKPLDKETLQALLEGAKVSISSYAFLKNDEKIDTEIEEYFGSLEKGKKKKIIFRRRNV